MSHSKGDFNLEDLRQRVAYLQGLADGLELDESSKEGKVLTEILDVLQDLTETVESVRESQDEIQEYLMELDEDLSALEEGRCSDLESDQIVEHRCPDCGQTLTIHADEVVGPVDLICPNCGGVTYATEGDGDSEESRGMLNQG